MCLSHRTTLTWDEPKAEQVIRKLMRGFSKLISIKYYIGACVDWRVWIAC
jgi:hypothetical protein